jgi:hypothetical protein
MGVGSRLIAIGLGMGLIRSVAHEAIGCTREKACDAAVDEVIGAIPGLGQFI